jgi:DNA repair exonuclease SbcCD nuclease subunit
MSFRFIHTADWQLGKPFASIPGDPGALLREARFEAVRRIARLASEHRVDAVLVAGDAFDANDVADATVHRALQAMGGFSGPWVLLPGNHDCHLAECVWTRIERLGCPAHVTVASRPEPIALADGAVAVLPAPLTLRHSLDDLTEWMDETPTPAGVLRIGLAHGSVRDRLPMVADATNPIAADRAERARLDYLALGDWHGTLEIAPRTWYAGTPEPDRYPANDPGNALLVELDMPGLPPRVEKLRTATHDWHTLTVRLMGEAEAAGMVDRALLLLPEPARALVSLRLEGTIGIAGRAAIDDVLARWRARLCQLRLDDRALEVIAGERDLALLDDGGVVGEVARRLGERARAGNAEERTEAELALRHLWMLLGKVPAA